MAFVVSSSGSSSHVFWEKFTNILRLMNLFDLIDIAIVAFLIYKLIGLMRETRAEQLMKGVIAILLLYLVTKLTPFRMLAFIMEFVVRYGAVVLVLLFQPELRKVLEQVGRSRLSNLQVFSPNISSSEYERSQIIKTINAICDACAILSKEHIGALIVMERTTKIGDIIGTGTILDSQPSSDLIKNVFFPNSPLHDGALIIRNNRLYAAGCFLPLSDNYEINRALGTRHRAALGISEVSDAVVVVVSEETGAITVAQNGKLNLKIAPGTLSTILYDEFIGAEEKSMEKKKLFRRGKK